MNTTITIKDSASGVISSKSVDTSPDTLTIKNVALPAAIAGTLTTRTSAVAGVLTVASHTFADGAGVFIFWDDSVQYAIVSSSTSTTITFASGVGKALPIADTAVTISAATLETLSFASLPVGLGLNHNAPYVAVQQLASLTDVSDVTSTPFLSNYVYSNQVQTSNPFSDTTLAVVFGNSSTTAQTAKLNVFSS